MKDKEKKHENDAPQADQPQDAAESGKEADAVHKQIHELEEKLAQAQKEKADVFAQLQRVSADYQNFQKRVPRQIADAIAYEKETLIRSLLPALDNFEHAIDKSHAAESAEGVIKGIQMVYDQVLGILKSHGVEQILSQGQKFDPSMHSAITQRSEAGKEDNIVLEDFAKGYKLNGRIIRPSRVAVNKIVVPSADASAESQKDGELTPEDEESSADRE